jgi:hypothetical protein
VTRENARVGNLARAVLLSLTLCYAGCTSAPEKDVGATAIGTGVGVVVCVVTLFACPAVLAVGAGGGMLVRKYNVSRHETCMRDAPKNAKAFKAREEYCRESQ